jgi:hypothetical protein
MKLPNFLIIGAQKAGTTSLYYYCKQHPDIFMSSIKEPMFFNSRKPSKIKLEDRSLKQPYSFFTLNEYANLFGKSGKQKLRGEASTAYLANPDSALWIRKIIPDTKIIAILRNPLERAYSAHKMYYEKGIETRTFNDAILSELENVTSKIRRGQQYLSIGLYGFQLKRYFNFFPKEQILAADYQEYNNNNVEFLNKVFKFLGVKEFVPNDLRRLLVSGSGKRSSSIEESLAEKMKEYYRNDIHDLQSLVDFDVLKWLQ